MRYLQLVHNTWDRVARVTKAKVLHSFGREDEVDRAGIERLIASLSRLLNSTAALGGTPSAGGVAPGLEFVSSRALGATRALDGLWHQLGLDGLLHRLLAGTRRDARTERVLFALVAARAIEPASKLATAAWLSRRTFITGLTDDPDGADSDRGGGVVDEDECYRAMDWLIEAAPQVEKEVFWAVASLLDLEVDLLFFDTTSTYFQTDAADEPVARDARGEVVGDGRQQSAADLTPGQTEGEAEGPNRAGFRTWGKSKDSRGDLPQIVIGMAVTRTGIPVRVWSWPGPGRATPPTPH